MSEKIPDPQEDYPGQDHQAATELPAAQAFTKQEISDHGGEGRFQGDDQVGDTGGQVTQTDVI